MNRHARILLQLADEIDAGARAYIATTRNTPPGVQAKLHELGLTARVDGHVSILLA